MNDRLLILVNGWSGNSLADAVMRFAARDLIVVVVAVLAGLGLQQVRRRRVDRVAFAGAGLVGAFALGLLAAALHPEQRPFQTHHLRVLVAHAPGQSFPSDHATAAFAVAFAVLVFWSRPWGIALTLAAVLIGFARVYDGIHYPGDVLGSALVAALGVGAAAALAHLAGTRRVGPTSMPA